MKITCSKKPLTEIHTANLTSIGKDNIGGMPKDVFALMLSEHSTLEFADIIVDDMVRGDVISHMVRHTKGHPRFVVQSARPDWTNKERPPSSSLRMFRMRANPIALMAMARQRLCTKAMKETRDWFTTLKKMMLAWKGETAEETTFVRSLAWALVPEGIYRGGCPYKNSCKACYVPRSMSLLDRYNFYYGGSS